MEQPECDRISGGVCGVLRAVDDTAHACECSDARRRSPYPKASISWSYGTLWCMLKLDSNLPVKESVAPVVVDAVERIGFSVIAASPNENGEHLLTHVTAVAVLVGQFLGKRCSLSILEGQGDDAPLPVHTEGIYGRAGICPYFALACLTPSESGGSTRIYDGRRAAKLLREREPSIADMKIRYRSRAYPEEIQEYSIVENDPSYGDVLRYRARVETNQVMSNPTDPAESEVYERVDDILRECVALEHYWNRGDLLFVNNKITLHDRTAYRGARVLLRMRIDEPAVTTFTY
jgi:hypothetical protein